MRKILIAITCACATALAAAAPASAECGLWDFSWVSLRQSNGFVVGLPAQQFNGVYNGRVTLSAVSNGVQRYVGAGSIRGATWARDFAATIWWDSGAIGNYVGHVTSDGWLWGETSQRFFPSNTATYTASRPGRCLW